MNILIIPNREKAQTGCVLDDLISMCAGFGHTAAVDSSKGRDLPDRKPDLIISVGGDGTFLRSAAIALRLRVPVTGINTGSRGNLLPFRYPEDKEKIQNILKDIRSARMIRCTSLQCRTGPEVFPVINEIALTRTATPGIFSVISGERILYRTRGSGLIICTALGSTGYSSSAGGAVLARELDLAEITPVCPIEGDRHSYVSPLSECCTLSCDKDTSLSIDGSDAGMIPAGMPVTINVSEQPLMIIDSEN